MFQKTMRIAKQYCFQINYKLFTVIFFIHSYIFLCDLGFVSFFFWRESYRIIAPFGFAYGKTWVSLVAQLVKNPPAMQTQVQSVGGEDPLEKGTAYPLQYSYLENPTDRRAW